MQHLTVSPEVSDKPLRHRAEIAIWREGKLLVARAQYGIRNCYSLPGGGIDEGEGPIEAAVREALEEVGIKVKNAALTQYSNIAPIGPTVMWKEGRKYSGSYTHFVVADFDCVDETHKGCEGDSMPYSWMTPQEAYSAFAETHNTDIDKCPHRLAYLQTML